MQLTSRIRQVLAVTILAAISLSLWTVLVTPIAARLTADREDLALARRRLQNYRDLSQESPEIQEQLALLRKSHEFEAAFLDGDNPTLLSAKFQQSVQRIVTATGAEIGSSQTVAVHPQGNFIHVGLQLEVTTNAAGLRGLLYAIETASPLIIVDRLAIHAPENGIAMGERADGQPSLSVSLELAAYARPLRSGSSS